MILKETLKDLKLGFQMSDKEYRPLLVGQTDSPFLLEALAEQLAEQ